MKININNVKTKVRTMQEEFQVLSKNHNFDLKMKEKKEKEDKKENDKAK